jgi:hypothetical protein
MLCLSCIDEQRSLCRVEVAPLEAVPPSTAMIVTNTVEMAGN